MREERFDPATLAYYESATTDRPISILRFDFSRSLTGLDPLRFVPNIPGIVNRDFIYEKMAMRVTIPDEGEKEIPQTSLELSNYDKRFMPFLFDGRFIGTTAQLRIVQESNPNAEGFRIDMDIEAVVATNSELVFTIGNSELLGKSAVRMIANRRVAPALFQ